MVSTVPDPEVTTVRRPSRPEIPTTRVRLAVLALGLGAAGTAVGPMPAGASAAGTGQPGDPVATALADPTALDTPAEVAALADATASNAGVPVGVVLDTNGAAPGGISVERIRTPAGAVTALTDRLDGTSGVVTAEVDRPVSIAADPLVPLQYGPGRIRATAPTVPATSDGRGTTVAVVDTGVTGNHADLVGTLPDGRPRVATGRSFLWGDPADGAAGNVDPHGHGTHVAGIIGAARDNGVGGAGVAPGAQILPVRALNAAGNGWASDITAAVLWSHQQGADVINLSLGGSGATPADVAQAIHFVTTDRSRGKAPTVVVAAGGNTGPFGAPTWPGTNPDAIAVAATDAADAVAFFSSRGLHLSVAAPGVAIVSTCRTGGWCVMSGTSMASPLVAGAAAVLRQQTPTDGPGEIRIRLEAAAVDLGPAGRDSGYGAGRVDLAAALARPAGLPAPAATLPTGSVDTAVTSRRRWDLAGSVYDPEGPPTVRLLDTTPSGTTVIDVGSTGGRWAATRSDATPGTHDVCAVAIDRPTGQGTLLGCRRFTIVK